MCTQECLQLSGAEVGVPRSSCCESANMLDAGVWPPERFTLQSIGFKFLECCSVRAFALRCLPCLDKYL